MRPGRHGQHEPRRSGGRGRVGGGRVSPRGAGNGGKRHGGPGGQRGSQHAAARQALPADERRSDQEPSPSDGSSTMPQRRVRGHRGNPVTCPSCAASAHGFTPWGRCGRSCRPVARPSRSPRAADQGPLALTPLPPKREITPRRHLTPPRSRARHLRRGAAVPPSRPARWPPARRRSPDAGCGTRSRSGAGTPRPVRAWPRP